MNLATCQHERTITDHHQDQNVCTMCGLVMSRYDESLTEATNASQTTRHAFEKDDIRAAVHDMNLPQSTLDRADTFLQECRVKRACVSVKLAALYIACIEMRIDRTLQEFSVASEKSPLHLSRVVRRLWKQHHAATGHKQYKGHDLRNLFDRFLMGKDIRDRKRRCQLVQRMRDVYDSSSRYRDQIDPAHALEDLYRAATKKSAEN